MRIKLDENLPVRLRPHLEAAGHEVSTVADEGLLRKPDSLVAAAAKAELRFLFTLDVDFGDIRRFPPGSHPGIALFRPEASGPSSVDLFVIHFVKSVDLGRLAGCLVIVESGRVRVRRPPPTSATGS